MPTHFHGPDPWPHITSTAKTASPRYVAIAYLGESAPDLLPLTSRDTLVVNASRNALRSHATSPDALQAFLERGVRVVSHDTLHAKVIATGSTAVIGSANASTNSQNVAEAVVVSDQKSIVEDVRGFVKDRAAEGTEVDETFLAAARARWDAGAGRVPTIPGVTGKPNTDRGFLPSPLGRVFFYDSEPYQQSPAERKAATASKRSARKDAGPRSRYELDRLRVDEGDIHREGDVVIQALEDTVYPPVVVCSPAIPIPWGRGAVGYVVKQRTLDDAVDLQEAVDALAESDLSGFNLRTSRLLRSDGAIAALLGVWNLPG
ncbi:phospholipase D family protein [Prescottella equi]|nr:phospholipase D family protein [Prescottella equi]